MSNYAQKNHENNSIDACSICPDDGLSRLHEAGFHLVPCGGSDGKVPIQRGWERIDRKKPSLPTILKILNRERSRTYGIRLDGLVVVDCDSRNDETTEWVNLNCPPTPFVVLTPRGYHFYFRTNATFAAFQVRRGSVCIDVKTGHGHQVLADGSVRPDGGIYTWTGNAPASIKELPLLPSDFASRCLTASDTRTAISNRVVQIAANPVQKGVRNGVLVRRAISYAADCESVDELEANLLQARNIEFEEPESVPDREVKGVAKWAWQKRLENKLYGGSRSCFPFERPALDHFRTNGNLGCHAAVLYALLKSIHSHQSGMAFAVSIDDMCEAHLLPYKKSAGYKARAFLIEKGLLVPVGTSVRGYADKFRFGNALAADSPLTEDAPNWAGRGLYITLFHDGGTG